MSSTSVSTVPTATTTPVVVSLPKAGLQLAAVVLFALLAYYFVGVDQGMTSVFGNNTAVHEFVHDARHFLGFPLPLIDARADMESRIVVRGMLAGLVGGVLAFVFARIFAEPKIQAAIDYESARDDAQHALEGGAHEHEHELFSRAVQGNLGIGVGIIVFGIAMGALFAVAYSICLGRVGKLGPRPIALLVAAGGFLGFYFVPFVKYPANPPAIGHEETIKTRGALYLVTVAASILFLVLAVRLGQVLAKRYGNWTAALLAGAAFVVAIGIVFVVLPSTGELAANRNNGYGNVGSETPLPLRNDAGDIVFPGFPADVLFTFRLYSVGAQLILWTAIGLVFAPLADRLLRPATGRTPERHSDPVPS